MINYLLISKNGDEEWEEGCYESLEALREAAQGKMDFLYAQDDFWGEKTEDGKLLEKIDKETFDKEDYIEQSYFGKSKGSLAEQSKKVEEPETNVSDDDETYDALSDPVLLQAAEETKEILSGPLVQKKKRTEQSEMSMLLNALATGQTSKTKETSEKIIELKTLIGLLMNAIDDAEFTAGKAPVETLAKQCFDIISELSEEEGTT